MNITINDVSSIIREIVEEELSEINHTTDSSGKTIIAQGAPGSIVRFATENPDIIKQMRDWIKDCQWADLPDEDAVDELSDEEVLRGIQNNYDGGIREFLRGSNSQAQAPIGLKENWSSGQFDDAPDGYSNDYQRAFAHSQATTPRVNDTKKAKELAKQGKYVVMIESPVFCKSTDACLGSSAGIHKVCDTREEAEKEQEKLNVAENSELRIYIIGPEDLEPKQHKDEPSTGDDVPFQESYGDMPKHQNFNSVGPDHHYGFPSKPVKTGQYAQKKLKKKLRKITHHGDINPTEGVGYVYDKDIKKDPKHIPGERWRVKFQEGVSKSELKGVIRELINEMWYGSKNDVDGDETHDTSLNEMLGSYDDMIEFVKSLPPEEQKKLNLMSKEMGASAAVIKYMEDLAKRQNPQKPQNEVAPSGFEGTVKAMKKHKEIDNPWALAWSMKNKGYKSHK